MNKKQSKQIFMSVEGVNCEKLYFEHLAALINSSGKNRYNLKVDPKPQITPLQFAKRNHYKPVDKHKRKRIPYFHVQDIEDYNNEDFKRKFHAMISEIKQAKELFDIDYMLGYSNYTFELWMLLHATDMDYSVTNRGDYLGPINNVFTKHYKNLDEYKKESEFRKLLEDYVTIDSVKKAVQRAEKLMNHKKDLGISWIEYKGVIFYAENPALSVHKVVKLILEICEVR